jgi:hypothetical protein
MATDTWNGVNGDWSDSADWTPTGVPNAKAGPKGSTLITYT